MRYLVVTEHGESSWGAHVPDLPGCIAVGETEQEALRLISEAIEAHIELMLESGEEGPLPRTYPHIVEVAG